MSAVDEVKHKIDILDIIGEHVHLTKSGRTFKGPCPFHSEKRPSFFVYPEQQSWHCFGACNTGGDVFSFIMKKQNMGFGDALRLLAQRTGVTIPSHTKPQTENKEKAKLYQINQSATQYFHNLLLNSPAGKKARDYISARGLSPKAVSDFQLGFSPGSRDGLKKYLLENGYPKSEIIQAGLVVATDEGDYRDRFRNRIMFPIFDANGHTVGFGGRVLDDSLPKYMNSPQTPVFNKSSILYGINLATQSIRQQDKVVIVEGYTDTITAHQSDFTNVVATMGIAITEKQLNILKKQTSNIVLALDADAAGEEAMLRCVSYENTLNTEIKVALLPEGKDPDGVIKEDPENWQYLLKDALPVVDYTFNKVASRLDLTTARGKTLAVGELGRIINEMRDSTRRAHYLQKLARLIKVNDRDLEAELSKIKSVRRAKKSNGEAVASPSRSILTDRVEEYCLALLLQYPELKSQCQDLQPEYFTDTQNREILLAYLRANEVKYIKEELDNAFDEQVDSLLNLDLFTTEIERKCADCILRLHEKFLKNLESKRAEVLSLTAEAEGSSAELAKLEELGTEISAQLAVIMKQRSQKSHNRGN